MGLTRRLPPKQGRTPEGAWHTARFVPNGDGSALPRGVAEEGGPAHGLFAVVRGYEPVAFGPSTYGRDRHRPRSYGLGDAGGDTHGRVRLSVREAGLRRNELAVLRSLGGELRVCRRAPSHSGPAEGVRGNVQGPKAERKTGGLGAIRIPCVARGVSPSLRARGLRRGARIPRVGDSRQTRSIRRKHGLVPQRARHSNR